MCILDSFAGHSHYIGNMVQPMTWRLGVRLYPFYSTSWSLNKANQTAQIRPTVTEST